MLTALRHPRVRRLLCAYTVNSLGDWMGEIALALIVLRATHSVLAVSAVFVLGSFVPAAAGPLLVARLGGRRSLPLLLAGEAALFALAAAAATAPVAVLLGLILLDGALAVAAKALLKAALVAAAGPAGLLREGNAALVAACATSAAVGPPLAGAVLSVTGPATALVLNAVSFLVAALAVRGLQAEAPAATARRRLRAAIGHLRTHPLLGRLCVVEGLANVAFSLVIPIEIVFITRSLHGSPADAGLVLGAWGVGAIAGTALLRRLGRVPLPALLAAGLAIMAVAYAGMGAAGGVAVAAAFSLAGGIGNAFEPFAFLTAIQERTPGPLQADVNALIEALHTAAPGLGFVLGGIAAWAVSPRATYWIAAIAVVALLLVAAPSVLRGAGSPRRRGRRSGRVAAAPRRASRRRAAPC